MTMPTRVLTFDKLSFSIFGALKALIWRITEGQISCVATSLISALTEPGVRLQHLAIRDTIVDGQLLPNLNVTIGDENKVGRSLEVVYHLNLAAWVLVAVVDEAAKTVSFLGCVHTEALSTLALWEGLAVEKVGKGWRDLGLTFPPLFNRHHLKQNKNRWLFEEVG